MDRAEEVVLLILTLLSIPEAVQKESRVLSLRKFCAQFPGISELGLETFYKEEGTLNMFIVKCKFLMFV